MGTELSHIEVRWGGYRTPHLKLVHGVIISFRDPRSLFVELVTLIPMTCEPGPGELLGMRYGPITGRIAEKGQFSTGSLMRLDLISAHGVKISSQDLRTFF